MQLKKFYILFYLATLSVSVLSQAPEYIPSFNSPVHFPIYLSGNFGELRTNHFHTGIDIKTGSAIGKQIHSIDKGYIARIKVSGSGYGKTLYIAHPDGFTSVYAHLDRFNKKIADYVKKYQYENEEFDVNIFPKVNELNIERGQLIAFSGNSGSSKGPHIHFEIRKTSNQHPLNPLFYKLPIKDNISPRIINLLIYPDSKLSFVSGNNLKQIIPIIKTDKGYQLKDTTKIVCAGKIGFGVETYDFLNGSRNWCGVYSIELLVNDTTYYLHELNELNFSTNRYINAHIDYKEKNENKKSYQKLFLSPNNKLNIYKKIKNDGIIEVKPGRKSRIEIIIKDVYANESSLSFDIIGDNISKLDLNQTEHIPSNLFSWDKENIFQTDSLIVKIPDHALYDTLLFNYSTSKSNKFLSDIHHIHNSSTALQKSYFLSIKRNNLDDILSDKMLIALIDDKGELESWDGEIDGEFIKTSVNKFGDFVVTIDTIAPEIKPLFNPEDEIEEKIVFKIKDDLSGIKEIKAYVDNNWALFEYDPKNDLIFYIFDGERIVKGQNHEIEIYITDYKDNIATYYNTIHW